MPPNTPTLLFLATNCRTIGGDISGAKVGSGGSGLSWPAHVVVQLLALLHQH